MRQMTDINKQRLAELQQIQDENDGLLKPEAVVEFAKDNTTALHSWAGWCDWDSEKLAAAHLIQQARTLIRAMVTVQQVNGADRKIRAFVSIIDDRKEGGYRGTVEVMQNPTSRQRMLQTALGELEAFRKRFADVQELALVFEAIEEALVNIDPVATQNAQESDQPTV